MKALFFKSFANRHLILYLFLLSFSPVFPRIAYTAELAAEEETIYTGEVVRIPAENEEETLALLAEEGGFVLNHRDDLWLVCYPENSGFDVIGSRVLRRAEGSPRKFRHRPFPAKPAMNNARNIFNASYIEAGEGLPMPYDGSGVVVGFCDTGFDATHPNFLNEDGSASRVKRFVSYEIAKGKRTCLDTPAEIAAFRSDTPDESHATHVAGILAGRGKPSPYRGMAPGAEIVATTSDLYEVGILAGVEDIIEYAVSVGKPAVINISVGSYNGPHDGSSLFCQYLDKCSRDAVICISSGNEGVTNGHIGFTFPDDTNPLHFRLYDEFWAYRDIKGQIDAWNNSSSPLRMALILQDATKSSFPVVYQSEEIDLSAVPYYIITSSPEVAEGDPYCHYDENFATYFTGQVAFTGETDSENGRFVARMYADAHTDITPSESKKWGRYQMGAYLWGKEGDRVDLFADCQYSSFKDNGVKIKPDSRFSVSNMATGENVISVGAFWANESVNMLDGSVADGGAPTSVCSFSSYGTLDDGRVTPFTVAPGGMIVSSYNSMYTEAHGTRDIAEIYDGYPWGINSGTSMSAPYTAGVIATWLQADPSLTTKDVMDIIEKTNLTDDYTLETDPRHGRGLLNPYGGMLEVVKNSAADVQTILGESLFATSSSYGILISNPDRRPLTVEAFSSTGALLRRLSPGDSPAMRISKEDLGLSGSNSLAIIRISAPGASPKTLKAFFQQ